MRRIQHQQKFHSHSQIYSTRTIGHFACCYVNSIPFVYQFSRLFVCGFHATFLNITIIFNILVISGHLIKCWQLHIFIQIFLKYWLSSSHRCQRSLVTQSCICATRSTMATRNIHISYFVSNTLKRCNLISCDCMCYLRTYVLAFKNGV